MAPLNWISPSLGNLEHFNADNNGCTHHSPGVMSEGDPTNMADRVRMMGINLQHIKADQTNAVPNGVTRPNAVSSITACRNRFSRMNFSNNSRFRGPPVGPCMDRVSWV